MTAEGKSGPPHVTGLPTRFEAVPHVDPTEAHRAAASAFLRGLPVAKPLRGLLETITAEFGWAEKGYVEQAREQGERSRVWDTTCWIIANALAREERRRASD